MNTIQNLMWTAGYVVDAIRNTSGIEEIELTTLRPMEGDTCASFNAFAVQVRPKSDMGVYRLARILKRKIQKAQKTYRYEHERGWQAFVFVDFLDSEHKAGGGISTDIWGRPEITIKIEPFSRD